MDERKGRKHYSKVIINILHGAFLNSYILYKQHASASKNFNLDIISDVVENSIDKCSTLKSNTPQLQTLPGRKDVLSVAHLEREGGHELFVRVAKRVKTLYVL